MTKQKRVSALLIAAVLCFAMLFSACFIGIEAHHDCTGADCVICDCIRICENLLKTVADTAFITVCIAAFVCVIVEVSGLCFSDAGFVTLVSLKVKLSD